MWLRSLTKGGSLQEVPIIVIWPGNFWYFRKRKELRKISRRRSRSPKYAELSPGSYIARLPC